MADFLINVIINPTGAVVGGKAVRNQLGKVDRAATNTSKLMNRVFLLTGAIAGIRVLASFEQAMSSVRAISGATEDQMISLTAAARDLGATTRFTATQAAEGLLFLSRAGFEVNEQLETIGPTLTLAQAGALDLGRAADIATNVLRGFRLEADQANDIVDVMAFTANRANTSVAQLGDALSFVAPVAAGLGVDVRETSAAIAALSDAGIQGQRAGTGLRRVLAELEAPGSTLRGILTELGISTNEVRVSQVGLTSALEALAMAGIDTGQALEAFGQRGGPAFEVLQSSIPQIQAMNAELQNATGFAADVAKVMDENLNGALLATKSALEAVILSLGEAFLTDALTETFRGLAAALRFTANNIEILIGVLAVLSLTAIPAAITATNKLAVRIALMLGPFGLIAIAIGAVVGALVAFQDDIVLSQDGLITLRTLSVAVFGEMKAVATDALGFVSELLTNVSAVLTEKFGPAISTILTNFARLLPTFEEVLMAARTFVNRYIGLFVGLGRALNVIFSKIVDIIVGFFVDNFGDVIPGIITGVVEFGGRAITFLTGLVNRALGLIGTTANEVGSFLSDAFAFDIPELPSGVVEFGAEVRDAFLTGFEQDFVGDFVGFVSPAFERIIDRAREAGREARAAVAAGVSGEGVTLPALTGVELPQVDTAFQGMLTMLRQEGDLLQVNARLREQRAEILRIEEELGRSLTAIERVQVEQLVAQNQAYADQAAILEQIMGPQLALIEGQAAINALLEQGAITTEQATQALRQLQLAALETDQTFSGGFARGLLRIEEQISNTGAAVENFLVGAFDRATDALTNFVNTGKLNFKSFVSSLLSDLARLASQQLLGQLFGLFPGGIGPISTAGTPLNLEGFQNGGSFTVGGSGGPDSQLVAFRASPRERVTVSPPGAGGGSVEFNIVNDFSNFQGSGQDFGELEDLVERNNEQLRAQIKEDLKLGNFI